MKKCESIVTSHREPCSKVEKSVMIIFNTYKTEMPAYADNTKYERLGKL